MMTDMSELGPKFKRRRTDLGLSQYDVADIAGMQQSGVSAIERGTIIPAWPVAQKLAEALGMTLAIIVAED
jgi:transcriptional regulator with XRE-family HTH domain